jgi:hypothetical protein
MIKCIYCNNDLETHSLEDLQKCELRNKLRKEVE